MKNILKSIFKIFLIIFCVIYLGVEVIVTVCLLNFNENGISEIGDSSWIIASDDFSDEYGSKYSDQYEDSSNRMDISSVPVRRWKQYRIMLCPCWHCIEHLSL